MNNELKNFLKPLILFLVPVVMVILYIECGLGNMVNSYSLKKYLFEKRQRNVEVVVMGSSHALHGINPVYFSRPTFNFANTSQSLFYDVALINKYIDHMPNLKVIVLPVSYFSLGYELRDSKESWRDYYYAKFLGVSYPHLPLDMKLWSNIMLYSWPIARGYAMDGFQEQLVKGMNTQGWQKPEVSKSVTQDQFGRDRVEFHEALIHQEHVQSNMSLLEGLLKKLKERGILCVLVRMPASARYVQYTHAAINDQNAKTLHMLESRYHAVFLDFWKDERFTQDLFADDDHLNSKGAKLISHFINDEIMKRVP